MTGQGEYFEYLRRRSWLGAFYRRHVLYPRLVRRLHGRLLDIGCGIGDMLSFRRNSVGVDINPQTVAYCRHLGLDARQMELDVLPFDAETFDSVLLDNVLEHLVQPDPLLKEAWRVLRPGGRLLVGVPGTRGWNSDPDHKMRYDERSLTAASERNGFRRIEVFHTPLVKSEWLARRVRQYCVYGAFDKSPPVGMLGSG
jgi:SAM-dependent methyltransferase